MHLHSKKPITKQGFENLKKKLHDLQNVDLPKIVEAISKARALGDLSENAEYKAAKEEQARLHSEMRKLNFKINNSDVYKNTRNQLSDAIKFGAIVKLKNLDDNNELLYHFVGEYESDYECGKISVSSLLGRSALGKKQGDIFEFKAPSGHKEFEVLDVKYEDIL